MLQQQSPPFAVVPHQVAAVIRHPPLHVVEGVRSQGAVHVVALGFHSLVVGPELVPPDVDARVRKRGTVDEVAVGVADVRVQVQRGSGVTSATVTARRQQVAGFHSCAGAGNREAAALHGFGIRNNN